MRKYRILAAILAIALLAGCSSAAAAAAGSGQTETEKAELSATATPQEPSATESASTAEAAEIDVEDMFTQRDYEDSYDAATAISLSDSGSQCDSDGVSVSGSVVTISKEGTYILSGELSDGMVIVDAEKTDKLQLVLNGVSIHSASSAAIYVRQADKVFITLAPESVNTLATDGEYVAIDENNIDAVIFSKDDLTLNGSGSLIVNGSFGHGIVAKDDLVLTGGKCIITAAGHGLCGKDSLRVADGDITVTSGKDGLHAGNNDDDSDGFIYIAGGSITVSAADDGMHANGALTVDGGVISITESYEGLEGLSVEIRGGEIDITASDDGVNAAGGNDQSGFGGFGGGDSFAADSDCYVSISGGKIKINASGDGIDSNGALTVSGGETCVFGPTNDGNGALDYAGSATITGGEFVAVGSSGMAMNFGGDSTQGAILTTVSQAAAGAVIKLTDSKGSVLAEYTAEKKFNSVLISCPGIVAGETYTLTVDGESTEIVMDSLIYGGGGMFGGPGGMGPMGGFDRGQGGTRPDDMPEMPEGMQGGHGGMGGRGQRPEDMPAEN